MNEVINDAETIAKKQRMSKMDDAPGARRLTSPELSRYKLSHPVLQLQGCLKILGDEYEQRLCDTLCGEVPICRFICIPRQALPTQEELAIGQGANHGE